MSAELISAPSIHEPLPGRPWTKTRAIRALELTGKDELAARIRHCGKPDLCWNPYCLRCHERMVAFHRNGMFGHVHQRYGSDYGAIQANLRFLTVLCETVPASTDEVVASVQGVRDGGLRAFRRSFPAVWMLGAFDFEMVDLERVFDGRTVCRANAEIVDALARGRAYPGDHAVSVHFHGLLDLNGTDEDKVRKRLGSIWGLHPRQVDLGSLYQKVRGRSAKAGLKPDSSWTSDELLSRNLNCISKYMVKRETCYKFEFREGERSDGGYMNGLYLSVLAEIYSSFECDGSRGIMIYSKL